MQLTRCQASTPSLRKHRVIKVVSKHVSDSKIIIIKKVFVEVSVIIMVVVLSFVGFVDSTDFFILEGGIGISIFF